MKSTGLVGALLLLASAAQAQDRPPELPVPNGAGVWEFGFGESARHNTHDAGRAHLWSLGMFGSAGVGLTRTVSMEAGLMVGWIPQVVRKTDGKLNVMTPTLSLQLQSAEPRRFKPYAIAGLAYEIIDFEKPPNILDRDAHYLTGHFGVGSRYMLRHNVAMRGDVTVETGSHRPAVSIQAGLSIYPGHVRPIPYVDTVRVQTLVRVTDTLRVTRVDTIRPPARVDTVRVSTVLPGEVLLTLDDVNFDVGQAVLRPATRTALDGFADQLNRGTLSSAVVEVLGFTDITGGEMMNVGLGWRRAKSVTEYLVSKGVPANRVILLSGGPGNPIGSNETADGRQMNRRVVVRRVPR